MNRVNVERLIRQLDNFYRSQDTSKLATVDYPESIKYKSNDWLIYIFYSCLLDYGMRSIIYHQNLIATYQRYPSIFDPHHVIKIYANNRDELLDILKNNIHPRYPNIALDKWINLSFELSKYDNLLDIVKEFNTFNELNYFVRSIKGYGQKTGGLLIRLIYESNIIKFNDKLKFIPLDRHDIEISYLNKIIDKTNLSAKEIEELSETYIEEGEKLGIDANAIDKYLWNIGVYYCNSKNCINCPLYKSCKTKLDTKKTRTSLIF